ncbi:unnamed protein product [Paramecium primaurelia]|uniref:Uncharacterized protein n=1 Tax=Paramecium primaurelia TaxID=5886 RepID=A0A8S1MSA5_PARPR|nr:unnamed protein product [Paramecium primaurelia]
MIEFLRKKGKSENKYDFESRIFLSLDLCRKFIYHFVLIFFQECPTLQFLCLSIISLSQCLIISKYEESSILDKIISILNEGTIAMFSLTCFPYNDINRIYFSNETIKSTGFIHMGLLLLNLMNVLFKQLLIKLQFILKGLYARKQPEQIKNIILNF